MDDLFACKQCAGLPHVLKDHGVGLVRLKAGVLSGVIGMAASVIDGYYKLQSIAQAGLIVIRAEAGSCVDTSGTGIHCDIVSGHEKARLRQEGMLCEHILKEGSLVGLDDLPGLKAAGLHDLLHQRLCHDIALAVGSGHDGIGLTGVEGYAHVAGQGPNGRSPDEEEQF